MLLRRRGFVKYLFLVPTLWFVTMLIASLTSNESPSNPSNRPISRIERAAVVSEPSIVDRLINALPFKQSNVDHDHPIEERHKALEQAREMNAQVQVVAPERDENQANAKMNGPGEMGNPVRIKKEKLSPEERKKYDEGWKNNAFNQYASDMISLRRSLPDVRDPE